MPKSLSTSRIFIYQLLSFGFYFFFWCHHLGNELNTALRQKAVPSMWWFVVPTGAYYWMWQMTGSLDKATGGRIKQADTFLLYVLFTCGILGGFGYGPSFPYHSGDYSSSSPHTDWQLVLTIVLIVVAVIILIAILLHAVFMSVVQSKLNKVRAQRP